MKKMSFFLKFHSLFIVAVVQLKNSRFSYTHEREAEKKKLSVCTCRHCTMLYRVACICYDRSDGDAITSRIGCRCRNKSGIA